MVVIGLTGNVGTGKTEVAQMLAELGAEVINADEVGHELLEPDTETYREVVAAFGKSILKQSGEIDRQKLGGLAFADPTALDKLNGIMHPRIFEIVKQKIEEYRRTSTMVVVLEAALLIEAGWKPMLDQVWVTTAPVATITERLNKARGLSQQQVLERLKAQMPQKEKLKQADVVINTDCPIDHLRTTVAELWNRLPA